MKCPTLTFQVIVRESEASEALDEIADAIADCDCNHFRLAVESRSSTPREAKLWEKYCAIDMDDEADGIDVWKYWRERCDETGRKEGWALFDVDGEIQIQKIDAPEEGEGTFERDDDAYEHVAQRALAGSKLHAPALWLDGRPTRQDLTYLPKHLRLD